MGGYGNEAAPPSGNHLEDDVDQFLQTVMGGAGAPTQQPSGYGSYPPSQTAPTSKSSRWGDSGGGSYPQADQYGSQNAPSGGGGRRISTVDAATYTCYEDVLRVVKGILNPMYQQQTIDRWATISAFTLYRVASCSQFWIVLLYCVWNHFFGQGHVQKACRGEYSLACGGFVGCWLGRPNPCPPRV